MSMGLFDSDERKEEEFIKRYDCIVIDSVNFAYRVFKHKGETPVKLSKKTVYKDSICNFINAVDDLRQRYLAYEGNIYLLFDNYFSRADLRSIYMYADRKQLNESYKANRKKESKEFYNSLNFLRYYYLIGPSYYHTLRVDNLEADDLVKPLFTDLGIFENNKSALMVTTDLDWTRYCRTNVDWLPKLNENPQDVHSLSAQLGFEVNEKNILMYKAIFGDASDNISALVTNNTPNFNDFLSLIEKVNNPEDLVFLSRKDNTSSPILKKISQDEKSFLANLQLVSTIECSKDMVKFSLTNGRMESTLYNAVRDAIGLNGEPEFVFGGLKRTRIS